MGSSSHRFTIHPSRHYDLDQAIISHPADMPDSDVVERERERRSPNMFWENAVPQMISGQGERWYSSVPPSRLAKKRKVYGKLILRKIIETVATRCHILKLKCAKFRFRLRLRPKPAGGAYSAHPTSYLDLRSLLLREGKTGGKARERGE